MGGFFLASRRGLTTGGSAARSSSARRLHPLVSRQVLRKQPANFGNERDRDLHRGVGRSTKGSFVLRDRFRARGPAEHGLRPIPAGTGAVSSSLPSPSALEGALGLRADLIRSHNERRSGFRVWNIHHPNMASGARLAQSHPRPFASLAILQRSAGNFSHLALGDSVAANVWLPRLRID